MSQASSFRKENEGNSADANCHGSNVLAYARKQLLWPLSLAESSDLCTDMHSVRVRS